MKIDPTCGPKDSTLSMVISGFGLMGVELKW